MHSHGHHAHEREQGGRRLLLSLLVVVVIMLVEIIGGILSGSLALQSDAGHMAVDAIALAIGVLAIRFGKRPPDAKRTYGYRRSEILATLANGVLLIFILGYIVSEAVKRFQHPQPILTGVMLLTAAVGLIANLASFWLLFRVRNSTHNIRAAFLHVISDGVSSVGVIGAGLVIRFTGWTLMDPIMSCGIAFLILLQVKRLITESVHILLDGSPSHLDVRDVAAAICTVPGVKNVHDLHITTQTTYQYVLTGHVVLDEQSLVSALVIVAQVRSLLHDRYDIHHATIEIDTDATSAGVQDRLYCENEPVNGSPEAP